MALTPRRPRRARAALLAAALLASLAAPPACGRREEAPSTAPAGIIQELQSGESITTDVNARAPAFAKMSFDGTVVRTQDYIGNRVLLLDFWSVFCQSCIQQFPFLVELHGRHAGDGLEIVGINTDFFPKERIVRFLEKAEIALPYPLIHDRSQALSKLFHVEALPVTVLIDSSGWIRMVHIGYRPGDHEVIEKRVEKALGSIRETVVTLQPVDGKTAFTPDAPGSKLLAPGTAAPEFDAVDAAGVLRSFADLRGDSPTLLFFWSLFCTPCREEFSHLSRLMESYTPRGLRILGVNIDSPKLRPAALRFLRSGGGGIDTLFDRDLGQGRFAVSGLFGVTSTPSIFLIGSAGAVRDAVVGRVAPEILTEKIDRLLSDGPSPAAGTASTL